jgi:DNA-directed RNA polymerase specialized sigma24 family protein
MKLAREAPPVQFPSTHWSAIAAAGEREAEPAAAALGRLLTRYEFALRRYLVERFRCDEEHAHDLFQGFVLHIIIENRLVARAKRTKGHQFRSFLLCALNNYVRSELRKQQALKRSPLGGLQSLDELEEEGDLAASEPEVRDFDLNWARSVLKQAVDRMRQGCADSGRDAIWGIFEHRLWRPILEGAEVAPYQALVDRFAFTSPAQAQNALLTAKRMFAGALRAVVASAIEVEIRELQLILASAQTR